MRRGTVSSRVRGPRDGAAVPASFAHEEIRGGIRLAQAILVTVLCAFLVVQMLNVVTSPLPSHGVVLGLGLASLGAVFGLQILHSSPAAARWPLRVRLMTLGLQALLTYLPLMAFGKEWGAMSGFFAGSVLLLVPGWSAWALFMLIVGSMVVEPLLLGLDVSYVAYLAISTLDVGLIVFGLSRLAVVIRQLHGTRDELAQLAVIRERMRFSRDLHDLLGYSLSAITLKAELTRRLVPGNAARARDEIAEVIDIARQALADVREVSGGYRNMSLAKEASSVASLLSAAGIDARVEVNLGALSENVDTVLATVLREAVTNMLRHSAVQHCRVQASQAGDTVRLQVTNDGVPRSARASRPGGGLENLTTRLRDVGGRLTIRVIPRRQFELLAEAPCSGAPADPGQSRDSGAEREENSSG
jgi:two-component system, NarL family, sensor histidine kinase DesK